MYNYNKYQLVWWPLIDDWAIGFKKLDPKETDLASIYRWTLCFGPVEIRRWV